MTDQLEVQIQTARGECADARNAAALPLVFNDVAAQKATDRDESQLRASLPQIPGGWPTVRLPVLRAATLSGAVAKAIAQFQDPDARTITEEQMFNGRGIAEKECKLKLAIVVGKDADEVDVSDGLVCG
jgi:hypothetical protein